MTIDLNHWIHRMPTGEFVVRDQLDGKNTMLVGINQHEDDVSPFLVIGSDFDGSDYVYSDVAAMMMILVTLLGREEVVHLAETVADWDITQKRHQKLLEQKQKSNPPKRIRKKTSQ